MNIPSSILEEIHSKAKDTWPEDREMREYFVKEEIDGYRDFQSIDFSAVSEKQREEITEVAREDFEDWDQIALYVEDEVEAVTALKKYNPPNIETELLNQWKIEAEEESAGYYRLQLDEVKNKVRRCESIEKTRVEIDPIKKLLIELEYIVGNECYNGNIQNYESWGELESEGRSFRYPVKFFDGQDKIKRRNVTEDIPSEELITGYYAFGANELSIYRALNKVLKHLEREHGLKLPKA